MAGILDFGAGAPFAGLLNLPQGSFPPVPQQPDPQAIWAAIEAEQAKANADADRRNAAGLASSANVAGAPPAMIAPDASSPGVAYAMGKPSNDFGTYGAPDFVPSPFSLAGARPAAFGSGTNPVPFVGGPVTPQPSAAPATDLSSVNRDRAPDDFIPVGNYQMPAFRNGAPAAADDDAEAPSAAPAPAVAPGAPSRAAPFSLAGNGGGAGDRLAKATRGFLGNLDQGPIGALAGGLGALVTGQSTDPTSIASEQAGLTARALQAKGASPAEVQAARYNPALMKALIDNYYGKDRWSVVQVGEDDNGRKTYMQQNQVDGTLRPIAGAPAAGGGASDTVTGPDGKPIQIPAGLTSSARKEFLNHIARSNADAATGKQTEAQAKASSFATRMDQAEKILSSVQGEGLSAMNRVAGAIPMAGNYLQSPEYQRYKQASSAFITAMLRQESGAAVNKSEFDRYEKELFPQPGDDPSVVAQKAQMRAAATEQMRRAAGPGFKAPAASSASGKTSSGITWSVQ